MKLMMREKTCFFRGIADISDLIDIINNEDRVLSALKYPQNDLVCILPRFIYNEALGRSIDLIHTNIKIFIIDIKGNLVRFGMD